MTLWHMIGLIKPFQTFALCIGSNQRQRRAWEQESIQDYHIYLIGSDTNIAVTSLPTTDNSPSHCAVNELPPTLRLSLFPDNCQHCGSVCGNLSFLATHGQTAHHRSHYHSNYHNSKCTWQSVRLPLS